MAEEFAITVKGVEDTCKGLDQLPRSMVKHAFAKALAAASVPVVRALQARTPKLTGDLVEHITTEISIDAQGRGGRADTGFGKEGWKARLVEYGHRMVGHKPDRKEIGLVAAHVFMAPATSDSADAAVEAFDESLRDSVESGLREIDAV